MSARTRSLLLLHAIVVVFGFTGILGKLITIDAEPLVFWRVTIGGLTTAGFLVLRSQWTAWPLRDLLRASGIGLLVTAHWVTFFASIKVSSVGLALTMLATAPLFVGFIEPMMFGRRIDRRELLVAGVVLVGIAMVFRAETDQTLGMALGLVSSILAALFSVLNGKMVHKHDPVNLSAVELLAASLGMFLFLLSRGEVGPELWTLSPSDWLWVAILAVVATSIAFMVSIRVLKDLSPFESAMAINLEPIYAIVLAYWFFDERFEATFYAGAALVIGAVMLDTALRVIPPKTERKTPDPQ